MSSNNPDHSGYYEQRRIVFNKIDERVKDVLENGTPLKIGSLVLRLTADFAVSEKAIMQRIELHVEESADILAIRKGVLINKLAGAA